MKKDFGWLKGVERTRLAGTNCEIALDGEAFTDWSASDAGEITIQTTVDDHHFLVRCG